MTMIHNVVHPQRIQRMNQNHTVTATAPHHHMNVPPPLLNITTAPPPQMSFAPNQTMMNVQQKQLPKNSNLNHRLGSMQQPPPPPPPHLMHNSQNHHHHPQNR